MKKHLPIITGIILIAILSITTNACSRKVGCYYSLTPEIIQSSPDPVCTFEKPFTK